MALPNTVYSERRCEPTMAQNSWPVVTPQQARPPLRCRQWKEAFYSAAICERPAC